MGILIGQKKAAPNEIKLMESHTQLIRMYLQSARNVNMTIATQNPEFFKKQMSFAEISKHLESLSAKGMGKYKEFEKANVEKSPGVYAMYKLAQYFGYSGNQKEEDLKQFFSEEKANFHGVYWDGDEWCVQLANYEFDHGTNESKLTYSSVEKIIKKLYICANYVLEHRQDTIFVNAYEYTYQVEGMAILLQASYNEGVNKYNTKGKKISHIAANPTSFKTKKFEEGGDITKEYSKEIERLGNSAGWSKLDHKVIDKNTIEVKRTDTSEKTVIKKSGDKWNLEKNYATSLTFEQAITLSNVLNFTKKIVKEGKWEGGADRPFQVDGMDIDFDRAGWFKIDTTLIDGDRKGNWMQFMNKIGITHKKLVDVLNGWYVGEYSRVAN